jgi:hypothetical protein
MAASAINRLAHWSFSSSDGKFEVTSDLATPVFYGQKVLTAALLATQIPSLSSAGLNESKSMAFVASDASGVKHYLVLTLVDLLADSDYSSRFLFNSSSAQAAVSVVQVRQAISCEAELSVHTLCQAKLSPAEVWLYLPKGVPIPGHLRDAAQRQRVVRAVFA